MCVKRVDLINDTDIGISNLEQCLGYRLEELSKSPLCFYVMKIGLAEISKCQN